MKILNKAIGMIEYATVSTGVRAADMLVKTAEVEIIQAETVCPGKYIVLVSGSLSAVRAAVDASKAAFGERYIDSFVLGNPHEDIFPAIYGASDPGDVNALGVVETYSVSAIIVAADVAAKTADVKLLEIRIAKGMCGKSYVMMTGEVAAVTASVEKAAASLSDGGMLLDKAVIPNPDRELWKSIL